MKITSLLYFLLFTTVISFSQEEIIVKFSKKGGLYFGEKLSVTLSTENTEATIFYSLDGSYPSSGSIKYKEPIKVEKNTLIRAKAYVKGKPSETFTQSYFIERKHTLPVVSITMNNEDLFSFEKGIYAKGCCAKPTPPYQGANFWKGWERRMNIELYEVDGKQAFNQEAGIRIFGGWSKGNPQKSFSIIARKKYGKSKFKYKLFEEKNIKKYNSFILRNSGGDFNSTQLRDAFMTRLVVPIDIDIQAHKPCVVYLNGAYWGIMNIREKLNEHYLNDNHDVPKDSITMMKHRMDRQFGTTKNYQKMLRFLRESDLSIQKNADKLETLMQVDNFINYNIAEVYSDNHDAGGNIRYWRVHNDTSRWRWILFDMDAGMGGIRSAKTNTLQKFTTASAEVWPNPAWSTFIIRKVLENEQFKNKYINRFADQLNTIYSAKTAENVLDSLGDFIDEEIPFHKKRWGGDSARWSRAMERVRVFAQKRPYYIRQHILKKFQLEDTIVVNLNADFTKGSLKINSIPVFSEFTGVYFKGVKVKVTATPLYDYEFSGWKGINSKESVLLIDPSKIKNLEPIFTPKKRSEITDIIINEFRFKGEDWVEFYNLSSKEIDINGWHIKDNSEKNRFTFNNAKIASNTYLLIKQDSLGLDFGFSSKGDQIKLYDNLGFIVDSISFTKNQYKQGASLSNIRDGVWQEETFTPGKINKSYQAYLDKIAAEERKKKLMLYGGIGLCGVALSGLGFLFYRRMKNSKRESV